MTLINKILRRLIRVHKYMLYKAPCDQLASSTLADRESVVVLDATSLALHAETVAALKMLASDASDYLSDVEAGRVVALVISVDGQIVHYSYVFVQNKSACILGLDRDTALIGNAFTAPDYRGKGCQSRSVGLRAAIAKARGFSFVAAETSPGNVSSQRGLQKGGMRFVGRLDLLVLLNCLVVRWRRPRGVPVFGVCLHG